MNLFTKKKLTAVDVYGYWLDQVMNCLAEGSKSIPPVPPLSEKMNGEHSQDYIQTHKKYKAAAHKLHSIISSSLTKE